MEVKAADRHWKSSISQESLSGKEMYILFKKVQRKELSLLKTGSSEWKKYTKFNEDQNP